MNGKNNKARRLIILIFILLLNTSLNGCNSYKNEPKKALVKKEEKIETVEIALSDEVSSKEGIGNGSGFRKIV